MIRRSALKKLQTDPVLPTIDAITSMLSRGKDFARMVDGSETFMVTDDPVSTMTNAMTVIAELSKYDTTRGVYAVVKLNEDYGGD